MLTLFQIRKARIAAAAFAASSMIAWAEYPVERPPRQESIPKESIFTIYPDQNLQVIRGLGFEIQSDSINSGNEGMPDATTSVPHDLVPSERDRFYREMLKGFRYCRLAGGLYWRGLDPSRKTFQGRWPEQMDELREMIDRAGVEGVLLEYWSPAPYWKANQRFEGKGPDNILKAFSKDFSNDPDYQGDKSRFLSDFSAALCQDIRYLKEHGIPVVMWGLQNEPYADTPYSSCIYTPEAYSETFAAVAPAIRALDPKIEIIADTSHQLEYIAPGLKDPKVRDLVDAFVVHEIGADSKGVKRPRLSASYPEKPVFQNEYEYLWGPASPARCLNTVQNIMNWYQLAGSPTWFWIHALKPIGNSEASGYSLGFWTSIASKAGGKIKRFSDGPFMVQDLPDQLAKAKIVSGKRGDERKPAEGFSFDIDAPATVFMAFQDRGNALPSKEWIRTDLEINWGDGRFSDPVYKRAFSAERVNIPGHNGWGDGYYGVPNLVFVLSANGGNIGVTNLSQGATLQSTIDIPDPGHWTWNKYNWHAVAGFLRHMPWNCQAVKISEQNPDDDLRILAFKRPDGKLTFVISNRCGKEQRFKVQTGLQNRKFKGYRYSPDETGENFEGVPLAEMAGGELTIDLSDMTWAFWEEQ